MSKKENTVSDEIMRRLQGAIRYMGTRPSDLTPDAIITVLLNEREVLMDHIFKQYQVILRQENELVTEQKKEK